MEGPPAIDFVRARSAGAVPAAGAIVLRARAAPTRYPPGTPHMSARSVQPWFSWGVLALVPLVLGCGAGGAARCNPGDVRACSIAFEGGVGQSGTQSCGATRTWSECVGAGQCRDATGAALAAYLRCTSDTACGPEGCGVCNAYSGVQNPIGARVCYPFCNADADCAPSTTSADVVPRCVLGQCILLCRTSSRCPQDAECLPWINAATGAAYPGFDGLCD
jgi:hypothetical protein